jgi:hypothetical protein
MAELTGFPAIYQGPQLMVKHDQWNVLHNRNGSK